MRWMIEEAKLGPDQREIIEEIGKAEGEPVWIQGHAGSGKSVVLLHALSDYLIRNKRSKVAVVVFTHALVDLLKTGLSQIPALRNRRIPVMTIYRMKYSLDEGNTYDAIFCDEVQDLPLAFIQQMREGCSQLVIAGDSAQSIYNQVPGFWESPADKRELNEHISPIQKACTTIYRMTESVLNMLKRVFSELLNDKSYSGKEDSIVRLFRAESFSQEVGFIWDEAETVNRNRPNEVNAILMFKREDIVIFVNEALEQNGKKTWTETYIEKHGKQQHNFDALNEHLENESIPIMYVGSGHGSLEEADNQNKIIVMTYHSAKGLDFDAVYLPFIETALTYRDRQDALILVALSRAKRDLLITFTGKPYSAFEKFLEGIEIHDIGDKSEEEDELLF